MRPDFGAEPSITIINRATRRKLHNLRRTGWRRPCTDKSELHSPGRRLRGSVVPRAGRTCPVDRCTRRPPRGGHGTCALHADRLCRRGVLTTVVPDRWVPLDRADTRPSVLYGSHRLAGGMGACGERHARCRRAGLDLLMTGAGRKVNGFTYLRDDFLGLIDAGGGGGPPPVRNQRNRLFDGTPRSSWKRDIAARSWEPWGGAL